jgi:ribosomal protein S18 acetylase RimI-like enzyme
MTAVTMRSYSSPADLLAMQKVVQRKWPRSPHWHVGDLAWQRHRYKQGRADWPTMLWEKDGAVVAWAWAHLPNELDLAVDPAVGELDQAVLKWFEDVAEGDSRTVRVLDTETHLIRPLKEGGYTLATELPFALHMRRGLEDLPELFLPTGFSARTVRGREDVERRVAVHQRAWSALPFAGGDRTSRSEVTTDSYLELMETWPYRPELDWVIESPTGEFSASCCVWLDAENGVGELEPVGTDPSYRRMGLASAVCVAGLHALHGAGATEAIVYPRGDEAYPVPRRLYEHLGFETYARDCTYVKNVE